MLHPPSNGNPHRDDAETYLVNATTAAHPDDALRVAAIAQTHALIAIHDVLDRIAAALEHRP